ncbi:VRR-NUC domain [Dillenia turbinata]|uniref:Fanconi-associated nuclease n=1 Tax=Dillenia turbinata TaxID=194707 RepID=A0AAN8YTX0_9MAGN
MCPSLVNNKANTLVGCVNLPHELAVTEQRDIPSQSALLFCELPYLMQFLELLYKDNLEVALNVLIKIVLHDILSKLKKKCDCSTRKKDIISLLLAAKGDGLCPLLSSLVMDKMRNCVQISPTVELLLLLCWISFGSINIFTSSKEKINMNSKMTMRSWSSGMPNLLLWRFNEDYSGEAKLVEVKGPKGRLSEQQGYWFSWTAASVWRSTRTVIQITQQEAMREIVKQYFEVPQRKEEKNTLLQFDKPNLQHPAP